MGKSREGIGRVRRANMQPAERQLADFAHGIRQNDVYEQMRVAAAYCGSRDRQPAAEISGFAAHCAYSLRLWEYQSLINSALDDSCQLS